MISRDFLSNEPDELQGLTELSYVVRVAGHRLVVGDGVLNLQQQPGQLGRFPHLRSVVEGRDFNR